MRVATLLLCCFIAAGCSRMATGPALPQGAVIPGARTAGLPAASGYDVLYSFRGRSTGGTPQAPLLSFRGSLYGTTSSYGVGYGTVFSVSAFGNVHVLHQFQGPHDGAYPEAGLTELNGKLYGTTSAGGSYGGGTVFEITPGGEESVLHSFGRNSDGAQPESSLFVHDGVLYGTTQNGGAHHRGTVFALTPSGQEQVLHSFAGAPHDGGHPTAGLVLVKGEFYGVTRAGGQSNGGGAMFEISPFGSERVIHSFGIHAGDGKNPAGNLLFHDGSFFGTTLHGGRYGEGGTVFEIRNRKELVLHDFGSGDDGKYPSSGLIAVKNVLFGTTLGGGNSRQRKDCVPSGAAPTGGYYSCGTIFKVDQFGQERVVYRFDGHPDGANPQASLTDVDGVLYGTTRGGGSATYYGTVFRILP